MSRTTGDPQSDNTASPRTAAMDRFRQFNPFSKRDSYSASSIMWYRLLTVASWALSTAVTVYYTVKAPQDAKHTGGSIWHQNDHRPSGFTLSPIIASVYWVALFILQVGYLAHLFSPIPASVRAACAVGSHFVLHQLLHLAFVLLFVRSHFGPAEAVLVLDFAQLSALYFRHSAHPRLVHVPAVAGPLAWAFVAVYWNGAIMVPDRDGLAARVVANICVWGILSYGAFFLLYYRDYTMGFALSVLAASLGVGQFFRQVIPLQWIFGFTIMAVLFVLSLLVAVPAWLGRPVLWERDTEKAPLLAED